jgi:transcriptional regulator with XRE-family HTH domain
MSALRELRTLSGLTQIEAAKRSGVDRTRLCLAEGGYVTLRPDEEESLRQVLLNQIESRAAQLTDVLSHRKAEDLGLAPAGA